MSDHRRDRNGRLVEALRRCRGAARAGPAACRRDRSSASSAGTAPARRRRSRCCLAWRARPKGEARVFGAVAAGRPGAASRSASASRFVSDEKDLYDYMTVGEIIAFTRSFYPRWRGDLEQKYLASSSCRCDRDDQGAVARHAHQAGVAAGALPRRGAADSRRADLGPRSGDGRRRAAGAGRPRRRAKRSTVFFSSHQLAEVEQIADHVAIIDRGQTVVSRRARRSARSQYQRIQLVFEGDAPEIKVHAPGTHRVQRQGPRHHRPVRDRRQAVIDELRGYRPASIDASPVTLERHLSGVGQERRTDMFWHKAWLETRWRFISALVILTVHGRQQRLRVPRHTALTAARTNRHRPAPKLIRSGRARFARRIEAAEGLPRFHLVSAPFATT